MSNKLIQLKDKLGNLLYPVIKTTNYISNITSIDSNLTLNANANEITKTGNIVIFNITFNLIASKTYAGTEIFIFPISIKPTANKVIQAINNNYVNCFAYIRSSTNAVVLKTNGAIIGEINITGSYTL